MSSIGDHVLDSGLSVLNTSTGDADKLTICSSEPTTYPEGNVTYALGDDDSNLVIGAPGDRGGGGREVTVSAISGGAVTADGTAAYWAILDTIGSRLLATGDLSSSQGVTNGNTFNLASFTVGIPDPA